MIMGQQKHGVNKRKQQSKLRRLTLCLFFYFHHLPVHLDSTSVFIPLQFFLLLRLVLFLFRLLADVVRWVLFNVILIPEVIVKGNGIDNFNFNIHIVVIVLGDINYKIVISF